MEKTIVDGKEYMVYQDYQPFQEMFERGEIKTGAIVTPLPGSKYLDDFLVASRDYLEITTCGEPPYLAERLLPPSVSPNGWVVKRREWRQSLNDID